MQKENPKVSEVNKADKICFSKDKKRFVAFFWRKGEYECLTFSKKYVQTMLDNERAENSDATVVVADDPEVAH